MSVPPCTENLMWWGQEAPSGMKLQTWQRLHQWNAELWDSSELVHLAHRDQKEVSNSSYIPVLPRLSKGLSKIILTATYQNLMIIAVMTDYYIL